MLPRALCTILVFVPVASMLSGQAVHLPYFGVAQGLGNRPLASANMQGVLQFVLLPRPEVGGLHLPLSRAPSLCLATVSLTVSATLNADSNRPQPLWQPPPTACLPVPGAASGVPSLLMHPWPAQELEKDPSALGRYAQGDGNVPPALYPCVKRMATH